MYKTHRTPINPNFLNISFIHVLVTEFILKTGFHKAESDVKFEFNSLFNIWITVYVFVLAFYFNLCTRILNDYVNLKTPQINNVPNYSNEGNDWFKNNVC